MTNDQTVFASLVPGPWSLVIASLLLAACGATTAFTDAPTVLLRSPDGKEIAIRVELADSDLERMQGLMNRTVLPSETGMLFVFPDAQLRAFWMKNTLIPLDVLFFDATGAYVSHATMQPCTADPCPSYASVGPAMWALELKGGETDRLGIGPGWLLEAPKDDQPIS